MNYLVPSVLAMATFGSFGLTGNISGPVTVLVFSCVGWVFSRLNYSIPATVIGILLGSMAEDALLQTYQISGGQLSYLFDRPMTMVILVMLLVSLFGSKVTALLTNKAKSSAST